MLSTGPKHEACPGVADIFSVTQLKRTIFPRLVGVNDSSVVNVYPSG